MNLSTLSIKRPVLTIVVSLIIILFGMIGYTFLGVREYPSIDPPIITVSVSYPGANADVIESQITEPLEESINGIAGIRYLTSTSRDGSCRISVEFDLSIDMEAAANDVRDRVSGAIRKLPADCDPPTVVKEDADASPIIALYVRSNTKSMLEISSYATNVIKERLQTIPGVSQVQIWGEKKYSMRLWISPLKLAAYKLTPVDVKNAMLAENVELPSGKIEGLSTELSIRTLGRLSTPEEFNNIIIKESEGKIVRLSDIGYAELAPETENTIFKRDGVPGVNVVLSPQSGSNHLLIAEEFYKRIEKLKQELPEGIEISINFDNTRFVKNSIDEVLETIFIAFSLVILIIFVFLRDWRTTLIPILAIPISLIGAFFIMYIADFTINVLTLLGIVLAIGLVVDDAIVVLENIYKKVEDGMPPLEAGNKGSTEIFFAIVSTTFTLAAVFLPIIFLEGFTGRLFREFGIVIAGSVIISALVALTLTPMLCTKLIKSNKHNRFYNFTEPFFVKIMDWYQSLLNSFLKHRWISLVIIAVTIGGIVWIYPNLQSELAPLEDRGYLRLNCIAAEGVSYTFMSKYMDSLLEMVMNEVPEREAAMMGAGFGGGGGGMASNSGFIRLNLVNPLLRQRSQQEIYNSLSQKVKKFNDARTFVIQEQTIGTQRGGLPIQYVLLSDDFDKLKEILPKFLEEARKDPTFQQVDVNLKFNKPEVNVQIDRLKAREMGVSVDDIAETIQLAYSGQRYGYYIMNEKQYQVIGQVLKQDRNQPSNLTQLYLKNRDGEFVQLDNLVNLINTSNPPQRYRYNRYISATVSASLTPGKTIGDGIAVMDKIKNELLGPTYPTALSGASKDFIESSSSLMFTFMLALVLIYLILSAQFESFRDPFIIMFTVPLAIGGALFSLWFFGQTMNLFSQIGLIMLIGLVTKNGILIVEFANQRQEAGSDKLTAVKEASVLRFRPILMTSLSTILGTLPIALALGAGSESRVSMGIAVIGGLIFSTILTLLVIPAIYSYLGTVVKHETESINPKMPS